MAAEQIAAEEGTKLIEMDADALKIEHYLYGLSKPLGVLSTPFAVSMGLETSEVALIVESDAHDQSYFLELTVSPVTESPQAEVSLIKAAPIMTEGTRQTEHSKFLELNPSLAKKPSPFAPSKIMAPQISTAEHPAVSSEKNTVTAGEESSGDETPGVSSDGSGPPSQISTTTMDQHEHPEHDSDDETCAFIELSQEEHIKAHFKKFRYSTDFHDVMDLFMDPIIEKKIRKQQRKDAKNRRKGKRIRAGSNRPPQLTQGEISHVFDEAVH